MIKKVTYTLNAQEMSDCITKHVREVERLDTTRWTVDVEIEAPSPRTAEARVTFTKFMEDTRKL